VAAESGKALPNAVVNGEKRQEQNGQARIAHAEPCTASTLAGGRGAETIRLLAAKASKRVAM
jgi:hypothetical protein